MFPQITKNKKKIKIGTDEMIKECDQVIKQLQFKHKKALKVLPAELVSDFHKVCRLKDINSFYSQYFFYFIQKASPQNLQKYFTDEVQNIMLGRSYYQKIQSLLKERTIIINSLKQQLQVVEGFSIMNSGKNLPLPLKGMINQLIKDCTSLDQVKTIQTNQVSKLAATIIKIRDNLKQIAQMQISWQYQLRGFCGESIATSFKKTKVIYPSNGINCIFLALYDTQFIKSSFLAQEIKFLGVQFDPFLLYIEPIKKTSRIFQEHFIEALQSSNSIYKKTQQYVYDTIPKNQKVQIEEKQLKRAAKSEKKFYNLQKSKSRDRKRTQKKLKDQFLYSNLIMGTNVVKTQMQNLKKQINIDKIADVYNKKKKSKMSIYKDENLNKSLSKSKSRSIQSLQEKRSRIRSVVLLQERQVTVTSSDNKSRRSIGSIDKNRAVMSKTLTNMKKIQNIYALSKNNSIAKISSPKKQKQPVIDTNKILKQKQELMKQLTKQKKQQQTLKKIIKRVQNRTQSQNKLYDKKMQQYEKEIQLSKSRIKQRQKKFDTSQIKEQKQKNKHNQLISKIYQKNKNQSPMKLKNSPQINLAQSQLIQQKNSNKLLQNKIKQLNKEKIKLQNLIQKQGSKVNKEKQLYERKLQKYQQIISKLKNQSRQSQNKIQDFNKKMSLANIIPQKVQSKQDKLLKMYTQRQIIGAQIEKKSPIKNMKQIKPKQILAQRLQKSKDKQIDSKNDLIITNNRNVIEIVYKPKKHKKVKKQEEQVINKSLIRQKQHQFEAGMLRLQKQKSILQRKLDIKMNEKSGTQIVLMKKLQQSEQQLQKYKQIINKQKSTHIRYDQKMRQLRKKINEQYEQKMQRQRQRFEQQKDHLYYKLKQQREQKLQKDKHLSKQMIFLKQMQMRQNELIYMLQNEKRQRLTKERVLQEQIMQKQQILQEYQLQQIKRVIQKQVRQQMNILNQQLDDEKDEQRLLVQQIKKQQIQNQIRQMMLATDFQLKQIDQQNQKLKQLIEKIKQEEHHVINNLHINMENDQQQQDQEYQNLKHNQNSNQIIKTQQTIGDKINISRIQNNIMKLQDYQVQQNSQSQPNLTQRNQKFIQQLQYKSQLQLQRQHLSHSRYQEIQQSPVFKEREKLQNIIEHYLRNPHQYPSNTSIVMKPQQKNKLIEDLTQKSKKAKQFQQQLMELKNVQSFVPAQRDDPITSHMLNLRQAYEHQEADSLRRILFPALSLNDKYDQQDLSFESQDPPPPVTFGDHLKVHEDKYMQERKQKKVGKNFMAINRMRLLQIEQQKKQKQRQLVEEQGRKKVRKILHKSKKKEQKQLKEFIQIKKQLQQKQRKRQIELQRAKKGKHSLQMKQGKNIKNQNMKKNQIKELYPQKSEQQLDEKNEFLDTNQDINKRQQLNDKNQKLIVEQKQKIKKTVNDKVIRQNKKKLKNKQRQTNIIDDKKIEIKQESNNKYNQKEQINQFLQTKNGNLNKQQDQQQNKMKQNDRDSQKFQSSKQKMQKKQTIQILSSLVAPNIIDTKQNKDVFQMIQENQQNTIQLQHKQHKQHKQKQIQQNQYDEQFQNQSSDQQNSFISPQNQTIKQLKQKLAILEPNHQLKKKQKEYQQRIKLQQENKNRELNKSNHQQDIIDSDSPSQNIQLMLLQHQRSSLKQDLLSYQSQIRSYISSYAQFQVYQHFVIEKELVQYVTEVLQLSSQQIRNLNNNSHIKKDILEAECLILLVAKDKQSKLQIGVGIFHKQFQQSEYVCGYLLAHDMKNFLNLTFNFSRYIYQHDSFCHSIEYIFTISALIDEVSKSNFADFEDKCKRLGQIYVKGKQSSTKKYVLKRNLFENIDNQQSFTEQKGVIFQTKVQIHQNLLKQKYQGFVNQFPDKFCSPTILLSLYLKNNPEQLQAFKKRSEDDLKCRETLITSMFFAKKQFTLKSVENRLYDTQQKIQLYNNVLGDIFNVDDIQQQIEELSFSLKQIPPKNFKRCILQINQISKSYSFIQFQEPLNRVQTKNSSQIGSFIPLVPKLKVLIIPAGQFLTSCSSNPDMNVFFYTKHFIKNITEVKKENISRVFLPEIKYENWVYYKQMSNKLKKSVFGRQKIQLGYQSKINNSVVFTPKHDDLVIERPFIISVLSANIERAIQGSPIYCKLIL